MNFRCRNKVDNRLNETDPEGDNHMGKIDNLGDYNKGMEQVETDRNDIQIKDHHPKQENQISNPYEHKNHLEVMEIISHFREIMEDLGDHNESREQMETDGNLKQKIISATSSNIRIITFMFRKIIQK